MGLKKCVSMTVFFIGFAFAIMFLSEGTSGSLQEALVIATCILMGLPIIYGFLFIAELHAHVFEEVECAEKEQRPANIVKVVKECLKWR